MGLGNSSLPSRAASTDPDVTFPVVTVSGCHSLMLTVDRLGGHLFPALAVGDFAASAVAGRTPLPAAMLEGEPRRPAVRASGLFHYREVPWLSWRLRVSG